MDYSFQHKLFCLIKSLAELITVGLQPVCHPSKQATQTAVTQLALSSCSALVSQSV